MITAANGMSVSAMKIFSITLRYFRDHAIQELRDATGTMLGQVLCFNCLEVFVKDDHIL